MIERMKSCPPYHRGSALIAALFLIVVLAALGAFAVRVAGDQRQGATLQLLQYRAWAAAHAGLEFWSHRVAANPALSCTVPPPPTLTFAGIPELQGFRVTLACTRIASGVGAEAVYDVTAEAVSNANFGNPEFVRRQISRRITNIGSGTWDEASGSF